MVVEIVSFRWEKWFKMVCSAWGRQALNPTPQSEIKAKLRGSICSGFRK